MRRQSVPHVGNDLAPGVGGHGLVHGSPVPNALLGLDHRPGAISRTHPGRIDRSQQLGELGIRSIVGFGAQKRCTTL